MMRLFEPYTQDAASIPGVAVYARNPTKGVLFLRRNLVGSVMVYMLIVGVGARHLATYWRRSADEGVFMHFNLLIAKGGLLLAFMFLTVIKTIFYLMLRRIDLHLPKHVVKTEFVRVMKMNLFLINIRLTVFLSNIGRVGLLIYFFKLVFQLFSGTEMNAFWPFLAMAVHYVRGYLVTKSYYKEFMDSSMKYEDNPYNMEEIVYGDETLKNRPDIMKRVEECSVCLLDYKSGDALIVFNCGNSHVYHKECISRWLLRDNRCPLCQKAVL